MFVRHDARPRANESFQRAQCSGVSPRAAPATGRSRSRPHGRSPEGLAAGATRFLSVAGVVAALAACQEPVGLADVVDPPTEAIGVERSGAGDPVDGARIAFVTGRHGGQNPEIYVMSPDGSHAQRVTNDRLWSVYPTWSPDQAELAFDGSGDLYVVSASGSNVRRLTSGGEDWWPAWSPDGTRIAFTRDVSGWFDWEIFVMEADGSHPVRLTFDAGGDKPTWSPDGTRIAFGAGDIYVMNADGSDLRPLISGPAWDQLPAWSPDGSRIAFTRATIEGDDVEADVWIVDVDGSNPVNLTRHPADDREPTWSPDGGRIAFSTDRDGNSEIYVMDTDGSNPVNLTRHPGYDGQPAWWR